MTKDEQARAIAAAACAHVSAMGECENSYRAAVPEGPYCDDAECTYCALGRAMEGYDVEG